MRHFILAITLIVAVATAPCAVSAQSAAEPSDAATPESGTFFDEQHRRSIYDAQKLSYGKAALWTLAFPGLGNIYTEQYFLAALAGISMVFAGFFIGFGVKTDQSDLIWTGVGITAVSYGWTLTTSLMGVEDYNSTLRQNLHLDQNDSASTNASTPGLTFTYRW